MVKIMQFVGGEYNGTTETFIKGFESPWLPEITGTFRHSNEKLNEMPTFKGYLTPMYDGVRYWHNNKWEYEFNVPDSEKNDSLKAEVIRYETQEVYDLMSN